MSLARAFLTVGGMTMTSRALGLVREILIAALLGAGPVAEALFVAFRFPNLFRRFFAEGAFTSAFVPLYAKRVEGEGGEAARRFAEEALSGLLAVLLVLTVAAQVAMPWFVLAIASGFADDPEKFDLTVAFSTIQFPYLLFISLTALYSGVLNSLGRFAAAAGAPILLNVAMIAALAGSAWLEADIGLWQSWSVFVAGVLQLLLVVVAARRAGVSLRLRFPRWTPDLRRLVRLSGPGAVAGGVTQLNILIGTTIATFFDGAVAWLTYADRLYQLPLGVVGVAIGVALLPELSRRVRAGDAAGARQAVTLSVAVSIALSLPAAVALVAIPGPIVGMLFGRGAFTEADVAATALATALYSIGLPAYVLNKALTPSYFAEEDTRTPVRYALWTMALNTGLGVVLAPVIGWIAVPISTSAAAWVNVWWLWRGLADRAGRPDTGAIGRRLIGLALASAAMGAALLGVVTLDAGALGLIDDRLWRIPAVLALVAFGAVVYFAAAFLFGGLRRSDLAALRRRGPRAPAPAGAPLDPSA